MSKINPDPNTESDVKNSSENQPITLSSDEMRALRFEHLIRDIFTDQGQGDKADKILSSNSNINVDKIMRGFPKLTAGTKGDTFSDTPERKIIKEKTEESIAGIDPDKVSKMDRLARDYYDVSRQTPKEEKSAVVKEIQEYLRSEDFVEDRENYFQQKQSIEKITITDSFVQDSEPKLNDGLNSVVQNVEPSHQREPEDDPPESDEKDELERSIEEKLSNILPVSPDISLVSENITSESSSTSVENVDKPESKPETKIEKPEIPESDIKMANAKLTAIPQNITVLEKAGLSSPELTSIKDTAIQYKDKMGTDDRSTAVEYAKSIDKAPGASFNGLSISNYSDIRSITIDGTKGVSQPITEKAEKGKPWAIRGYLVTIPGQAADKPDRILVGTDGKVCASTTDRFQTGTDFGVNLQTKRDQERIEAPQGGRTVLDVYASKMDYSTRDASSMVSVKGGQPTELVQDANLIREARADIKSPGTVEAADRFHSAAEAFASADTRHGTPDERFSAVLTKVDTKDSVISSGKELMEKISSDSDMQGIKDKIAEFDSKIEKESSRIPDGISRQIVDTVKRLDHIDVRIGEVGSTKQAYDTRAELNGSKDTMSEIYSDIKAQSDYIREGQACKTYDEKMAWLEKSSPLEGKQSIQDRIDSVNAKAQSIETQNPAISKDVVYFDKSGHLVTLERPKSPEDRDRVSEARREYIRDARSTSPTIGFQDGLDTTRRMPSQTVNIDGREYRDIKISMVTERDENGKPTSERFVVARRDEFGNTEFFGANGERFATDIKDASHYKETTYSMGTEDKFKLTEQVDFHSDVTSGKTTYGDTYSDIISDAYSKGISQAERSCQQLQPAIEAYGQILSETSARLDVMHGAGVINDDEYKSMKAEVSSRQVEFDKTIAEPFESYKASVDDAKKTFDSPTATAEDKIKAATEVASKDQFTDPQQRIDIMQVRPLSQSDIEKGANIDNNGRPESVESRVTALYNDNKDRIDAYKGSSSVSKEDKANIQKIDKIDHFREKYEAALQNFEGYADLVPKDKSLVTFNANGTYRLEMDYYSWRSHTPKPDGKIATMADVSKDFAVLVNDIQSGRFGMTVLGEALIGRPVTLQDGKPMVIDGRGNAKEMSAEKYQSRLDTFNTARENYVRFMGSFDDKTSKDSGSPYSGTKMSVAQEERLGFNAVHKFELALASYKSGIAVDAQGNVLEGVQPSKEAVVSSFVQLCDVISTHPSIVIFEIVLEIIESTMDKYESEKIDKDQDDDDDRNRKDVDAEPLEPLEPDNPDISTDEDEISQEDHEEKDSPNSDNQNQEDSKNESQEDSKNDEQTNNDLFVENQDDSNYHQDDPKDQVDQQQPDDTKPETDTISSDEDQQSGDLTTDDKQNDDSQVDQEPNSESDQTGQQEQDIPQLDDGEYNPDDFELQDDDSVVDTDDSDPVDPSVFNPDDFEIQDTKQIIDPDNLDHSSMFEGGEIPIELQSDELPEFISNDNDSTDNLVQDQNIGDNTQESIPEIETSSVETEDPDDTEKSTHETAPDNESNDTTVTADEKSQDQKVEQQEEQPDKPEITAEKNEDTVKPEDIRDQDKPPETQENNSVATPSEKPIDKGPDAAIAAVEQQEEKQSFTKEKENSFVEDESQEHDSDPIDKSDDKSSMAEQASSAKGDKDDEDKEDKEKKKEQEDGKQEDDKKVSSEHEDQQSSDVGVSIEDMKEVIDGVMEHGGIDGTNFSDFLTDAIDKTSSPEELQSLKETTAEAVADKYKEAFQMPDGEEKQQAIANIAEIEHACGEAFDAKDSEIKDTEKPESQSENFQDSKVESSDEKNTASSNEESSEETRFSDIVDSKLEDTSQDDKDSRIAAWEDLSGTSGEITTGGGDESSSLCDFLDKFGEMFGVEDLSQPLRDAGFDTFSIEGFKEGLHELGNTIGEGLVNKFESQLTEPLTHKGAIEMANLKSELCGKIKEKLSDAATTIDNKTLSTGVDVLSKAFGALEGIYGLQATLETLTSPMHVAETIVDVVGTIADKFKDIESDPTDSGPPSTDNVPDVSTGTDTGSSLNLENAVNTPDSLNNGETGSGVTGENTGTEVSSNPSLESGSSNDPYSVPEEQPTQPNDSLKDVVPNAPQETAVDAEKAAEAAQAREAGVEASEVGGGVEASEAAAIII